MNKRHDGILLDYQWLKKYQTRLNETVDNTWDIITALPDFDIIDEKESRQYSTKINDIYREISFKIDKGLGDLKDQLPKEIFQKENYLE
ncbi:MAG TPA: hypothetical protein QF753_17400 [Victivallales bacterium]|nr:hypothetical protein [Victivallales bacterium]